MTDQTPTVPEGAASLFARVMADPLTRADLVKLAAAMPDEYPMEDAEQAGWLAADVLAIRRYGILNGLRETSRLAEDLDGPAETSAVVREYERALA